MRALLDDVALLDDEDQIGILDRRETVDDHEGGASRGQAIHRLLDQYLGAGIYAARRFVEDQERCVLHDRAGW